MNSAQSRKRRLAAYAAGVVVLLVIVGIASNSEPFEPQVIEEATTTAQPVERGQGNLASSDSNTIDIEPVQIPEPISIALGAAAIAGLLVLIGRHTFTMRWRLRRPSLGSALAKPTAETSEEDHAEAIAEIARDLIEELHDGDSPRFAVQRAYAAVETGFGAQELERRPAETPLRYLSRIFGRHQAMTQPLHELTDLFQRARFSSEPVDEAMRLAAIDALSEIRDYYQAIAATRMSRSRSRKANA